MTLEDHHGECQDTRQAYEAIRSGRVKSSPFLPASTGSQAHLQEPILFDGREFQRLGDGLIGADRQASLDFFEEVQACGERAENLRTAQN